VPLHPPNLPFEWGDLNLSWCFRHGGIAARKSAAKLVKFPRLPPVLTAKGRYGEVIALAEEMRKLIVTSLNYYQPAFHLSDASGNRLPDGHRLLQLLSAPPASACRCGSARSEGGSICFDRHLFQLHCRSLADYSEWVICPPHWYFAWQNIPILDLTIIQPLQTPTSP